MLKLLFPVIFLLGAVGTGHGEICLLCNCVFVNVTKVEPKNGPEITFKYDPETIELFNSNTTYDTVKKYFYVDCSSKENVGQIDNLEWPKLRVLGIFGNFKNSKWKKLEFFPENVKKQMTVLSLSDNLISEIEEFELYDFNNLKMMNLTKNQITNLKKGTFSKLPFLKILDLSRNWITEIEDWAFYGTQLQYLNLSMNFMTYLKPDTLRGLNNLTVLDLSDNRLIKLPDEFGNSFPSLTFLSLRKNRFEKLPELPKNLKMFDVSSNQLTDLHLSHLYLEILDISNNQLVNLLHTNFPNLKVLQGEHNNLSELSSLSSNQIKILNLAFNKFTKIPEVITSEKLPLLEELYLDGNMISNVSFPSQSEPFSHLTLLSLSHMKSLKKIVKNSFLGVFSSRTYDCSKESGVEIKLTNNSIKFVDKEAFQTFGICSIDLSRNQLKSLSETLVPWKRMSYVNFQKNPWQCDCNIQWMLDEFLIFMYKNYPSLLVEMRCSTPLRYENKLFVFWYNKSDNVFCNSGPSSFYLNLIGGKKVEIWTASAIVCVVLACFIFVTAVIIVVLACTKPSKKQPRRKPTAKKNGPPYYKQIQNSGDDKSTEQSEKSL